MASTPEVLRDVPLFALLDDEEIAVLAAQVELRKFARRQRIYKMGDPGGFDLVSVLIDECAGVVQFTCRVGNLLQQRQRVRLLQWIGGGSDPSRQTKRKQRRQP